MSLTSSEPRSWRPEEVVLVQEVAERTWEAVERSRAEAALRASETRLQATVNQAAVGIIEASLDRRLLRVNVGFCHMLGYTPTEVVALSVDDVTHPDDRDLDHAWAARLLNGDLHSYALEKRYLRKDGSPLWVAVTVSLVHNEEGQPAYAVAIVQDIDDRKRAEIELRASEDRFRTVVDLVPDLLWSADSSGKTIT